MDDKKQRNSAYASTFRNSWRTSAGNTPALAKGWAQNSHAMKNPRAVGISAPQVITDLETQTHVLSDLQVQMQSLCREGYEGCNGTAAQLAHNKVLRGNVWWVKPPTAVSHLRKVTIQWLLAVSHLDFDLNFGGFALLLKDVVSAFSVKGLKASTLNFFWVTKKDMGAAPDLEIISCWDVFQRFWSDKG